MKSRAAPSKPGGSRFRFIGEIVSELKKVVWLSRREAIYLTVLVIIVSIVVGVILGVLDYGFTHLVEGLFLGK